MSRETKVLITGGNGMVGGSINLPNTLKIGREYGDLRSWKTVMNIFEKKRPTHVIHCAAKVGGVKANMEQGGCFYYDNILINTNIIHACYYYGIEKIVNFSSTCVFPDKANYPLTVDQIHSGSPHESNAPYAYAKRMAIVQLEAYRKQYGLKSATIIPCNIYGPNDNYHPEDSHVIPALIQKCWKAAHENKPFVVWGSGKPIREFIYAKDVARYAEKMIFDDYEGTMIVSPGVQWSIRQVAEMIAEMMGFKGEIVFDDSQPDGQFKKPSNNWPCFEYRGDDFELTPMSIGLKLTIEDFLNREETGKLRNLSPSFAKV
jgi:GDP-L-fucose synthase